MLTPFYQHLMCILESSIQGSGQTIFIISLKLSSFAIWDPVTETSISYSSWIQVYQECVDCSSCVQVRIHTFWALKWKWAHRCVVRLFAIFMPSNTTRVIIPFIRSPAVAPFVRIPFVMNPRRLRCTNLSHLPEFQSLFLISGFQDLRYPFSMFLPLPEPFEPWIAPLVPLDFHLDFPLSSLLFPLPVIEGLLLDHDLPWLPLPDDCLPVFLIALQSRWKFAPPHLNHPSRGNWWPVSFAWRERVDRSNIHGIWVFTQTRVTRLGITNSWTELRLHGRHDLQTCIFKSSQAIGVENQVFLELLWYQRFQASQLDLVVHLVLQLLLVSRHVRLPALNSRLEFQKRGTSRRNDRAKKVSLSSFCRRIISFL